MKGNDEYAYLYVAGSEGPCVGRLNGNEAYKGQSRGVAVVTIGGVEQLSMLQKLGLKVNKWKTQLQKWKNGVGERIEMKLWKTLANIGSGADVKLVNTALGEYGVLLTNNRSLVVNLARRACSCKWWQLEGLPCAHAMAVIEKQKLWVHDYVGDYYKAATQNTIYINSIHPMKTHDSATMDNAKGLVVGGEALDDGYDRRILSPINPRPQGRPRQRRIES
ncbi:hypothetical protein Cgig2_005950 [Carnegiea gigantea]|uniref:SWIM-type domain-containing protein n=1 Tax=Carnegiea gigantea TaxID=171969 RepID=A0A9Q1KJC9_9CARY|nr:hypothetical protein Cgig2_005950 [Carnegiea gigantea]